VTKKLSRAVRFYRAHALLPIALIVFAHPSRAQQAGLRKDASACQWASAVVSASGYAAPSGTNTEIAGMYTLASTGENDPIHILTVGTEITRVEIAASSGMSIRILKGGRGRLRTSAGQTKDLSTVNTFHERVPSNPALSMLVECASPNVQAIDLGMVNQNGLMLHKIDLAWTSHPGSPSSMVAQDQLKYSKTSFFIDPQQNTVAEMDQDHFAENDPTVPFPFRRLYSGYKSENGRLIPHTIATYVNGPVRHHHDPFV
jgi:hypothetical protein